MSENDYIAEYVKEKYPEILQDGSYGVWRFARIITETRDKFLEAIKEMDFSELKSLVERMKNYEHGSND